MNRRALAVVSCLWLASISPFAAGNGFLGMHLSNAREFDRLFTAMDKLDVSWVRREVAWSNVEPKPGQYDWRYWDQLVDAAAQHHFQLLLTIRAISPWGSTQLPSNYGERGGYKVTYPPKDLAQYSRFAEALVARYRGRVAAWQIENEVDSKAFWGGTRDEYVALLKAGYAAAHRADPSTVVLPAGLSSPFPQTTSVDQRVQRHREWFDAILDTHAFDAVDVHDYQLPESNPAWRTFGVSFEQYLDDYRTWMRAKGVSVSIWISEAGVNSAPVPNVAVKFTPDQQSRDLEAIVRAARSREVAHVFWLKVVDSDEGPYSHMGLAVGQKPKPAAAVYRRLAGGTESPTTPRRRR